jgi:hypothetical protein
VAKREAYPGINKSSASERIDEDNGQSDGTFLQ